jgi:hypothetical protein
MLAMLHSNYCQFALQVFGVATRYEFCFAQRRRDAERGRKRVVVCADNVHGMNFVSRRDAETRREGERELLFVQTMFTV